MKRTTRLIALLCALVLLAALAGCGKNPTPTPDPTPTPEYEMIAVRCRSSKLMWRERKSLRRIGQFTACGC